MAPYLLQDAEDGYWTSLITVNHVRLSMNQQMKIIVEIERHDNNCNEVQHSPKLLISFIEKGIPGFCISPYISISDIFRFLCI